MKDKIKIIEWARENLISKGYTLTHSPELILTTPWSSVMRFLTSQGYIYLKQMAPMLSMEPNIILALRNELQATVPIVIALSRDLNCYLMKDAGNSLRQTFQQNFKVDLLCQAVKQYSTIQQGAVNYINIFFSLGVPDWRLEKLPMLYQELMQKKDLLIEDGLISTELDILHELSLKFTAMCQQLSHYGISETLDHCDFHDNNILIKNNNHNLTIIDWGESVITHPFFSLITYLSTIARRYEFNETDLIYQKIQTACFGNWFGDKLQDHALTSLILARKLWFIYLALGHYRLKMSSNAEAFKVYPRRIGRIAGPLKDFIKVSMNKE